jgi:hypothetical protein
MNTIVFRQSWFKTLKRYTPEMVVEFMNALDDFSKSNPINITNDRVMDLWEQVEPLLESDKEKYDNKVVANRENGKKGGRPKKTEHNPSITEHNLKQPTETQVVLEKTQITHHNLKDIDIDIDKDKDIDIDKDRDTDKDKEFFLDEKKKKQFYINNKVEVEYIRSQYGYSLEEAIQVHYNNIRELDKLWVN